MKRPEGWRDARFTLGIAAATAVAGLIVMLLGATGQAADWGGWMPARLGDALANGDHLYPLLGPPAAALVHLNLIQLATNLLALVVCGRIVEAIVGGGGLLLLYVAGAYAAAAGFYLAGPDSTAILVGAGGAAAAAVGAYAMLAGRLRAKLGNPVLARAINVLWFGAAWILVQVLLALTVLRPGAPDFDISVLAMGIAATAGGYVAGLLLARPLLLWKWRGA
jgi:membrane associated rhomboid family serine protease